MAPENTAPVLDLSTLAPDRPRVTIDGADFFVRSTNEFGLLDQHRLRGMHARMAAFYNIEDDEDLTEDHVTDLTDALDDLCLMVIVNMTEQVLGKLGDGQKLQLVEVFTKASPVAEAEVEATPEVTKKTKRTTATQSPDSNGSTGETPSDG